MSFAETEVVVKSVSVVEWIAVPVDRETPLVLIELAAVGIAVPLATFQSFTVAVPVSAVMFQAAIVHAKGTVVYNVLPDVRADPPPSKVAAITRGIVPPAPHPVQVPLTVRLLTVVVPVKVGLAASATAPVPVVPLERFDAAG